MSLDGMSSMNTDSRRIASRLIVSIPLDATFFTNWKELSVDENDPVSHKIFAASSAMLLNWDPGSGRWLWVKDLHLAEIACPSDMRKLRSASRVGCVPTGGA